MLQYQRRHPRLKPGTFRGRGYSLDRPPPIPILGIVPFEPEEDRLVHDTARTGYAGKVVRTEISQVIARRVVAVNVEEPVDGIVVHRVRESSSGEFDSEG